MTEDALLAIMRTLAASVKSGLNASLTPHDCRILLAVMMQRYGKQKKGSVASKIINAFGSILEDSLDDIINDFRKGKR